MLRTSVSDGRRGGLAAALGIITGCLAWGLATAVGLTALLTASHAAYDAVRISGAAYLAWLGGSALWRARRRVQAEAGPGDETCDAVSSPGPDPSGRAAVAASRGPFAAFSRAFRAAYGVSPSDYRAAAIGLHRPD